MPDERLGGCLLEPHIFNDRDGEESHLGRVFL